MLIYRVENKEGNGPYIFESICKGNESMNFAHCNDFHPGMWSDCNRYKTKYCETDYYCGFSSLDQLYTWFKGWLYLLHKKNFFISVYETEEYIEGKYQTMFVRTKSTLIETVKL